ncbi:hypothetical protein [Pontibacter indicus]|uniref:hypothetical protein n=1 Tax=Pontibacter indicus TaxID=1317125 RepID=UPI00097643F2|nr:hypothetical protein [Pontibacter indicus]
MKILLSNWINVVGIIVTAYLYTFFWTFSKPSDFEGNRLMIWLFGSLFTIFGYGMMSWLLFVFAIVALDMLLIFPNRRKLTEKLLIEWLLIISPFIYWAFKYDYWLWIMLAASFLLTQLLRKRKIERIT